MIRFYLDRVVDDSGISGTGRVAGGCIMDDGICVLRWSSGKIHSTCIYNSIEELLSIHGHEGHTKVVFIDDNSSN